MYQLDGVWPPIKTAFFMKAMFCREIQYSIISKESINFLKDFASRGNPFALTDYNKIFDAYHQEFTSNRSVFLRSFFNELEHLDWPTEDTKNLWRCFLILRIFH